MLLLGRGPGRDSPGAEVFILKRCSLFVLRGAIACGPVPKKPGLLKPFGSVEVPAVSKFVAAEHFVVSHPSDENLGNFAKGFWIITMETMRNAR